MITRDLMNDILGIRESYQMPERLMTMLMQSEEANRLMDTLSLHIDDYSYDVLRDYFQSEQGDRKALKQDFTPDCVCKLVASLSDGFETEVTDICAGSGALTIAKIADNPSATYCCDEFASRAIPVLILNMALRNVNCIIRRCDVLTGAVTTVYKLEKGEKYSKIGIIPVFTEIKTSLVISNPPYSMKWEAVDNFKSDPRFIQYGIPPKQYSDLAFILDGIHRLKEGGTLIAILPHGVLFRGNREAEIRAALARDNLIDAVIGLPNNLFLNTGIPVFILVLKKNRKNSDILFIDASKDFFKDAKVNNMTQEHIDRIISTYKSRRTEERFSSVVSTQQLKENDFNMNIPRYVDTYIPEPVPDILDAINELMTVRGDMEDIERQLVEMMNELSGGDDNFSEAVGRITDYNATRKCKMRDLGTLARMDNSRLYPAGTIMIELSATKGVVKYCHEATQGNNRYAALEVSSEYNPYYIWQCIDFHFPEFIAKYQTTINLQFDVLKYFEITIHTDRKKQDAVAMELRLRELELMRATQELEQWKSIKQYMLDKMFVGSGSAPVIAYNPKRLNLKDLL